MTLRRNKKPYGISKSPCTYKNVTVSKKGSRTVRMALERLLNQTYQFFYHQIDIIFTGVDELSNNFHNAKSLIGTNNQMEEVWLTFKRFCCATWFIYYWNPDSWCLPKVGSFLTKLNYVIVALQFWYADAALMLLQSKFINCFIHKF